MLCIGDFDHPIISFVAHSKRTLDTLFLNNSTVIATSGKGKIRLYLISQEIMPSQGKTVSASGIRYFQHIRDVLRRSTARLATITPFIPLPTWTALRLWLLGMVMAI